MKRFSLFLAGVGCYTITSPISRPPQGLLVFAAPESAKIKVFKLFTGKDYIPRQPSMTHMQHRRCLERVNPC